MIENILFDKFSKLSKEELIQMLIEINLLYDNLKPKEKIGPKSSNWGKILPLSDLNSFLENLKNDFELIAPIKTDIVRYEVVEDISQINLTEMPYYSFKKYLQPQEYKIADIKNGKLDYNFEAKKRVVFGAWLCDLMSLPILDKLFLEEDPPDPYYKKMRENTTFIGVISDRQIRDEFLFENRIGVAPKYDLLFFEMEDQYFIDIGSERGRKFVGDLVDYEFEIPKISGSSNLVNIDIADKIDDILWDSENANGSCLGCGSCTLVCPTCMCFSISDDISLDLQSGERKITWDSCQIEGFTKVAGDEVFRDSRLKRFKHRIYHKIQYFKEKYGIPSCTGCGRCIRQCPSKIDYMKIVDELIA